jgi:hypothetical protein
MNDPLNLVICADAVLGTADPMDDQVWEVAPASGEPRAFAIRTQYGGRVAEARYFPVFLRRNDMVVDPRDFHTPPEVKRWFPNYLEFSFSPLEGVDVGLEYWAPASRILTGRITILNHNPGSGKLEVDWVGQFTPMGEGDALLAETIDLNTVLTGGSSGLKTVCFISGGCGMGTSIYPGLSLQINPRSTKPQFFTWASATEVENSSAYHIARNNAFRSWEAEISRVESVNEGRWVEINTGRKDWDAVLHASQKVGYSLVFPTGDGQLGFLRSRVPQAGFAGRQSNQTVDQTAYGQTSWDSLHMTNLLLPGGADQARGFLENLLNRQEKDGRLGWSSSHTAGKIKINAQPVAAQIALALEPYQENSEWLGSILPSLKRFFLSWFLPSNDRDGDGFPEWRASGQSGWEEEDLPWIGDLESPGLAAMLLKEAEAIRTLSARLNEPFPGELETIITRLNENLLHCWDESKGLFRYRDYETHLTAGNEILLEMKKAGNFPLKRKFPDPVRFMLKVESGTALRKQLQITLRGNCKGEPCVSELKSRDFSWRPKGALAVTRRVFSRLDRVTVRGLAEGDTLRVETCDSSRQDFSLTLPVITDGIPEEILDTIICETLSEKFLFEKGLRVFPGSDKPAPVQFSAYLAEGLLGKGERMLSASIFRGLLDDLSVRLRDRMLPPDNSLENTLPVSTFLKICGVEALTRHELILNGFNPFPGLVEVRYRNVKLLLQADKSVVLLNQEEPKVITSPERIRIPLGHSGKRS